MEMVQIVSSDAGQHKKGALRIGDHWNAITIIALSQSNPLKAIAEFIENSIDAKAKHIVIFRGKEAGRHYLRIVDDGTGIPKDAGGIPDFKYVATHICDSIKRSLKAGNPLEAKGIQGEFGIGLLSFWTIGDELIIRSAGNDGRIYQMTMKKGHPRYNVSHRRSLLTSPGTELIIRPLLPGIRQLNGEKIQWYLASELRNRILESGVEIRIVDRTSRCEYKVEPRKFTGRRLGVLPPLPEVRSPLSFELYLDTPRPENKVGLYRLGTRVLESITELDEFNRPPWNSAYLLGMIDAPLIQLTPGTRLGIIRGDEFQDFCRFVGSIEPQIEREINALRLAEEERASKDTLNNLQKAFRDAMLALPPEEYDWFDLKQSHDKPSAAAAQDGSVPDENMAVIVEPADERGPALQSQPAFFDFPGPLHAVRVSPAASLVAVNQTRNFRAVARDRKSKTVTDNLTFNWELGSGSGALKNTASEIVEFTAPEEPGLVQIRVTVTQTDRTGSSNPNPVTAEAQITVAAELEPRKTAVSKMQGLPGYTFYKAPGELWRSRYDEAMNLVVVNNGHRDFVFATRSTALKLRYLSRLFAKELVQKNFPGASREELLERLIEISMYVEESLR